MWTRERVSSASLAYASGYFSTVGRLKEGDRIMMDSNLSRRDALAGGHLLGTPLRQNLYDARPGHRILSVVCKPASMTILPGQQFFDAVGPEGDFQHTAANLLDIDGCPRVGIDHDEHRFAVDVANGQPAV